MTTKLYKGYSIRIVGLSHHIYRPGDILNTAFDFAPGYAQSMAATKRWINEDIRKQKEGSLSLDGPEALKVAQALVGEI